MSAPDARGANTTTKTCLFVVVLSVAFCALSSFAAFFFGKNLWGELGSTFSCMAAFELNQKALLAYAEEHEGKLPPAATWQTDTKAYYERLRTKLVKEGMPAEFQPQASGQPFRCDWNGKETGIAYNTAIAGKKVDSIADPDKTALVFEVPSVKLDQAMSYTEIKNTAPKLFMNRRDWIVYYIEGERDPFQSSESRTSSYSVTVDDALEKPKSPETAKAPTAK